METRKDAQGEEDGNELGKFGQYQMRRFEQHTQQTSTLQYGKTCDFLFLFNPRTQHIIFCVGMKARL